MIRNEEKQEILNLLHKQVVPAIGCTEPMAVALCVAKESGKNPSEIIDLLNKDNL